MNRIQASGALGVLALSVGVALAQAPANMSFFVTSANPGKGGNLGGLAGADAHCQALAQAVGAGGKTWRAYLSTSTVDAKDRIGSGPWQNVKGQVIAQNVADLHSANNKLTAATALTEHVADVPHGRRCRRGATSRGSAGARHPHGHERGRHQECRHVQQLDGRRGRHRDARPCGPHGPQSRRELVERDPRVRGLLDGEADAVGWHRLVLLLRDQLIASRYRGVSFGNERHAVERASLRRPDFAPGRCARSVQGGRRSASKSRGRAPVRVRSTHGSRARTRRCSQATPNARSSRSQRGNRLDAWLAAPIIDSHLSLRACPP